MLQLQVRLQFRLLLGADPLLCQPSAEEPAYLVSDRSEKKVQKVDV